MHDVPNEKCYKFKLFGIKIYTVGCLWELVLLSSLFGYMDVFTIIKYDIFTTTMTGNIINLVLASSARRTPHVIVIIVVIICHTLGGAFLSARLLVASNDRKKTLFALLAAQGVLLIVDLTVSSIRGTTPPPEYVVLLSLFQGALFHWSSKTGYSTALQTINLQRMSEGCYRYIYRYSQGGPRHRGDMLYTVVIVIAFLFGGFLCSAFNANLRKFVLLPPLVVTFSTAFNFGGM